MAFTKVVGAGIHTLSNIASHNINSSGIITATKFVGPTENGSGISTFYDLKVTNNLTVEGTTTTLDTNLTGVDRVEVNANSNSDTAIIGIQSGTADIVNLFDGTTEVVTVTDGGKVGIGSETPQQKLDVAGIVKIYGDSQGHGIRIDADSTGGTHETLLGTPSGDLRLQAGNASYFASQANILLENTSKNIIINAGNDGKVGIGTDTPSSLLEVASDSPKISLTDTDNNSEIYLHNVGGAAVLNAADSDIAFQTPTKELVRFQSTGNVGIGTDNPDARLNVFNSTVLGGTLNDRQEIARFHGIVNPNKGILEFSNVRTKTGSGWESSAFRIQRIIDVTRMGYIDFGTGAGSGSGGDGRNIQFGSGDGTIMMHLDSEGKVGIGTTNPGALLNVYGSPAELRLQHDGNSSYSRIISDSDNQLNIYTGGGPHLAMRIDGSQRVGIGTTNPKRSLHVNDTVGEGIAVNGATSGIQFGLVSMAGASYNAILSRVGTDDQYVTGTEVGDLCLAPEKEGAFILGLSPHLGAMNVGLRITRLRNYEIYFNSEIKINTGSPASPSEKVRIKSDGHVGIGTDDPSYLLHVLNGGAVGSTENNRKYNGRFTTYTPNRLNLDIYDRRWQDTQTHQWVGTEKRIEYNIDDNVNKRMWMSFFNPSSTTNDNVIRFGEQEDTEWMRIDNADVGINTDFTGSQTWRSGQKLEIFGGGGNVTGELHLGANRGDGEQSVGSINFFDNTQDSTHRHIALIEADKSGSTTNKRGGDLLFYTKNDNVATPTEKLRIHSGGLVEANSSFSDTYTATTSISPHIRVRNQNGTDNIYGGIQLRADRGNGAAAIFNIACLNSSTSYASTLVFQSRNTDGNFSEKMRISADGQTKLNISSNSALTEPLVIRNGGSGADTNVGMIFYNGDETSTGAGALARIKALDVGSYDSDLIFETGLKSGWSNTTVERLRIASNGLLTVKPADTSSNYATSDGGLDIGLSINSTGTSSSQSIGITFNLSKSGETGAISEIGAIREGNGLSGLVFRTRDNTTGRNERLRITSGGHLLVGNTSTDFTTSDVPVVFGSGSGTNGITIYAGSTSTSFIHFADGTSGAQRYAGGIGYNHNDTVMNLSVNDTPRVRINDSNFKEIIFPQQSGDTYARRVYFTEVAANAQTYTKFATITGPSFRSGIQMVATATIGNVVCNVVADIEVGHHEDIMITSKSLDYTQTAIKVVSDKNQNFDLYIRRSGGANQADASSFKIAIHPGLFEQVTFNSTINYSESSSNNTVHEHGTIAGTMRITGHGGVNGNFRCEGSITKGSGSFTIPHPLASKKDTHYLNHSFIEGPQCDNIYRGKVTLSSGSATVNLDTVSNMSEGTFVALNRDVQCFTTNESGWGAIKGSVSGNVLTITAQDSSSTDTISWMVVGERQDDTIKSSILTDSDGNLKVESLIEEDYDTSSLHQYYPTS